MNAHINVHRSFNLLPTAIGVAAVIHLVFILSVGFDLSSEQYIPPALEVVLVKQATEEPPEVAQFLAQHTQQGGGESTELKRPSAPVSGALKARANGTAAKEIESSSPKQTQQRETPELTQIFADQEIEKNKQQNQVKDIQDAPQSRQLTKKQEIARLTAELSLALERQASRPRSLYVTASTKQSNAANYMLNWVQKVERVGNLNFPANSVKESASLVLVVGINQQGAITKVAVQRSSGQPQLDEAAVAIVKMAAPFDPMPPALASETDILYVTRTWQFNSDNSITTR